jgi:uncharacterized protein YoxC
MKKIDFGALEFKVNWASASTIVTLLVAVITLFMTNKSLKNQVDGLSKSNETLTKTVSTLGESVSTLKGAQEITAKAIEIFMLNSPQEIKYRVEELEKRVFPGNTKPVESSKPFTNNKPN